MCLLCLEIKGSPCGQCHPAQSIGKNWGTKQSPPLPCFLFNREEGLTCLSLPLRILPGLFYLAHRASFTPRQAPLFSSPAPATSQPVNQTEQPGTSPNLTKLPFSAPEALRESDLRLRTKGAAAVASCQPAHGTPVRAKCAATSRSEPQGGAGDGGGGGGGSLGFVLQQNPSRFGPG